MGFNFIGISLFIMLMASVIWLLVGIAKKNKKILNTSKIVLLVVVILYIIGSIIFHHKYAA